MMSTLNATVPSGAPAGFRLYAVRGWPSQRVRRLLYRCKPCGSHATPGAQIMAAMRDRYHGRGRPGRPLRCHANWLHCLPARSPVRGSSATLSGGSWVFTRGAARPAAPTVATPPAACDRQATRRNGASQLVADGKANDANRPRSDPFTRGRAHRERSVGRLRPRPFHGTLELVAILEGATTQPLTGDSRREQANGPAGSG
jgi:hypothetical protein